MSEAAKAEAPAEVKKMRLVHLNHFPPGNRGGLFGRGRATGHEKYVSINVFMPPLVDYEIAVNVPATPRKLNVNTGDMMPVISWDGGSVGDVRLRVARKFDDGLSWAPLTIANVYEDAKICWGRGNPLPPTLLAAWNLFWTAPFNADLAPRTRVMTYEEWLASHPPEVAAVPTEPPITEGMRLRVRKMRERLLEHMPTEWGNQGTLCYLMGDHVDDGSSRLADRIERLRVMLELAKAKYTHDAVTRKCTLEAAKKAVPIFGKIEEKMARLRVLYDDIGARRNRLSNTIYDWEHTVSVRAGQMAPVIVKMIRAEKPIVWGAIITDASIWDALNYNGYGDMVQTLSRLSRKETRSFMEQFFFFQLFNSVQSKLSSSRAGRQYDALYQEYVNRRHGMSYKDHFEKEWVNTLAWDKVACDHAYSGYYQPPVPFPSCDGTMTISFHTIATQPDGMRTWLGRLPRVTAIFHRKEKNGCAWSINDGEARLAFFKRLSAKVSILFCPGVDGWAVTNGVTVLLGDSADIGELQATLEAEETTDEIDTKAIFRIGMNAVRDYDNDRKGAVRPAASTEWHGEALVSEGLYTYDPGLMYAEYHVRPGESLIDHVRRTNYHIYRMIPVRMTEARVRHTQHRITRAQVGNHCGCQNATLGDRLIYSHAWCSTCHTHVCRS